MTEEAEIDRIAGASANSRGLLANLIGAEHRAGQRAERPGLSDGGSQLPIHGAGHRCLHDGDFDVEKLDKTAVRPHSAQFSVMRYALCTLFGALRVDCMVIDTMMSYGP